MFIINLNLLVLLLEILNNLTLIDCHMAMTASLYFNSHIIGWIVLAGCIPAFGDAFCELLHEGEHNRKKKFDIGFSNLQSTSSYPLLVMTMFYLILSIVFLTSDRLMQRLPVMSTNQRETDVPLIALLGGNGSSTPSSSTLQETVPMKDSHNILLDTEMDKDNQGSVKGIIYIDQMALMNDNLDACYHNMECSITLGPFQTFNHMYSNMGYLALARSTGSVNAMSNTIIAQAFFFNVGLMMCLEVVASAFYHICPNPRTYHNDTLFVEIALMLQMVRFYFVRRGGVLLNRIFELIIFAVSFHFIGNSVLLWNHLNLVFYFNYDFLLEAIRSKDWRKWLKYYWRLLVKNEENKSLALKKLEIVESRKSSRSLL
ncbi:unnamed protein product [Litomosoides sigmodontis]|uniref:Uncharacterized protein n=1 Tax=Litomosoides sigmodontis TaxID=42156 RepID=A0A3P6SGK5_LITSI|nr:unnamed protein product [Litomosoides sigmodontis]